MGTPRHLLVALTSLSALAGCSTPSPDHGRYAATTVEAPSQPIAFPRDKRAALVTPPDFPCVRAWTEQDLARKGIAALPPDTEPNDGALVLHVRIEAVQGPGGYWNPFNGAIASAHARTDVGLALQNPGAPRPHWRVQARVREVLTCADAALRTQVEQLLTHIH